VPSVGSATQRCNFRCSCNSSATLTHAAELFNARISSILLYEDGNLVYVYPEGGVQSPPACHGSNGDYTSFSMNRPRAKEYLAALLMAQAAGKTVSFRTHGACIDQGVSDTLMYFKVNSQ
jgi:hypothetical protein